MSGEKNLLLLLAGENLASLESMIDSHIRPDSDVQSADFIKFMRPIRALSLNIPI